MQLIRASTQVSGKIINLKDFNNTIANKLLAIQKPPREIKDSFGKKNFLVSGECNGEAFTIALPEHHFKFIFGAAESIVGLTLKIKDANKVNNMWKINFELYQG